MVGRTRRDNIDRAEQGQKLQIPPAGPFEGIYKDKTDLGLISHILGGEDSQISRGCHIRNMFY